METLTAPEISLGLLGQIPPGEGRNFEVQGRRVAAQAECPHRVGPLADGLLGGTTLVCPLHAWKFDLRTGEALYGNCGITTFPVRLSESGEVFLTLPAESE